MIHLRTSHGTGDTYMTMAFAQAVQDYRMGEEVAVNTPVEHAPIASMFPDVKLTKEDGFHCHPSEQSVDPSVFGYLDHAPTHADIWRAMLKLPWHAPMARGRYACVGVRDPRKVFLIPETNSWRPTGWPGGFRVELADALRAAGWKIYVNGPGYSLDEVLYHCHTSEWVIGMQCGVMAILCHAKFLCRKTFITPPSEVGHDAAMPVWRFSGDDYDVEEIVLRDPVAALMTVMDGKHAHLMPYTVEPSQRCLMPCTPGDLLDRLSVLTLKMKYLSGRNRAAVIREFNEVLDVVNRLIPRKDELERTYIELLVSNDDAWHHNELSVTGMFNDGQNLSEHFALAARHNRKRVELRNRINELCSAPGREVKSYYEGNKP